MRTLSSLVICCGLCLPLLGAEDITIRGANTDNPTLLYKQKPMLKTGPISEDRVFMYAIKFKKTKGKILRCYDVDRDRTYALLDEKLRTHAGR